MTMTKLIILTLNTNIKKDLLSLRYQRDQRLGR